MKEPAAQEFRHRLTLDIFGIRIIAGFSSPQVKEDIARDFAFFAAEGAEPEPRIKLFFSDTSPDLTALERKNPVWKTRLFAVYDSGETRFIDYNGQALAKYDFIAETGFIWCRNTALMHELAYLLILSRAGECLDLRGTHRIHALGFAYRKKGGLLILPSGGGKTTLCVELLKNQGYSILSDDIPLVTSAGLLLPFPLRLGLRENSPGLELFSPGDLRRFNRRIHPPKILVDIGSWRARIADSTEPAWIFIGCRGEYPLLRRASRFCGFRHLAAPLLLGLGTPQIAEYVLRPRPAAVANMGKIFLMRLLACVNLLRRSEVYMFRMCRDPGKNFYALDDFLSRT